jgi:hypothetical protein
MRRLLIVGLGDIAQRMVPLLAGRCRIYALARDPRRFALLRALGVTPFAGLAHDVTQHAPPPDRGARDTRTAHLVAALAKGGSLPQHFVHV